MQCICANENGEILILLIIKYREGENVNALVFEKDESPVTEYIANGKLFYIMSNLETKTAAWSDGNLCITINDYLLAYEATLFTGRNRNELQIQFDTYALDSMSSLGISQII